MTFNLVHGPKVGMIVGGVGVGSGVLVGGRGVAVSEAVNVASGVRDGPGVLVGMGVREGVAVAERAGIALEPLRDVSVRTLRLLTRLPTPVAARLFASRAGNLGNDWPILGSTLQSLRRGRPTEIDYLNGEIVRRGRELGVPTPRNAKVVELVHGVESTGRFYHPQDLRHAFQAPSQG